MLISLYFEVNLIPLKFQRQLFNSVDGHVTRTAGRYSWRQVSQLAAHGTPAKPHGDTDGLGSHWQDD